MDLYGRKQLFTSYEPVKENLSLILNEVFPIHLQNREQCVYLESYYRGKQDILTREKKIRPEIDNKIVENHAYEIAEFHIGYSYGEPIQYVKRGDREQDDISDVSILNDMMLSENKQSKDLDLAHWMKICGTAYRMTLPKKTYKGEEKEAPFRFNFCSPLNTFVVKSTDFEQITILNVQYVEKKINNEDIYYFTVYCDKFIWEFTTSNNPETFDDIVITQSRNTMKMLPIIEYPANPARLGCFEPTIGLLNAINTLASDRINGLSQFVQHLVKFINCDIDEEQFKKLVELGAIKVKSIAGFNADVDIIAQELNQDQIQVFADYMYQQILNIAGVPDRNSSTGGNTGQALVLNQGWSNVDTRISSNDTYFERSEREFLKIILYILSIKYKGNEFDNTKVTDIDIVFDRNKTDNAVAKTQSLMNQVAVGIDPRLAIETCGLYSDPEYAYLQSKETMLAIQKQKITGTSNLEQTISQQGDPTGANNPQNDAAPIEEVI